MVAAGEGDFLFSAVVDGPLPRVGGGQVRIADEDVVRYDASAGAFELLFDGSEVGLEAAVVDAFAFTRFPGAFVLSFAEPVDVPGVGLVDDSDVVEFVATGLGEGKTTGSFALFLDGSDIGLTEPGEDLDAVEVVDETVLLSTSGSFSVRSATAEVSGEDEDVFRCAGRRGSRSDCVFNLSAALDGSAMGMGEDGEDVDGFALTSGPSSELESFFSTSGPFSVNGASGRPEDLFSCRGRGCGPPGSFRPGFRGSSGGIRDITAVDFAVGP
jgi:hypothetical protein